MRGLLTCSRSGYILVSVQHHHVWYHHCGLLCLGVQGAWQMHSTHLGHRLCYEEDVASMIDRWVHVVCPQAVASHVTWLDHAQISKLYCQDHPQNHQPQFQVFHQAPVMTGCNVAGWGCDSSRTVAERTAGAWPRSSAAALASTPSSSDPLLGRYTDCPTAKGSKGIQGTNRHAESECTNKLGEGVTDTFSREAAASRTAEEIPGNMQMEQ